MDENQHIEALLLDYIEGRLNKSDRKTVEAYLAAHPEVGDTLEGMDGAVLQPETEGFENRDSLKFPTGETSTEIEAREFLYVLALDGELSSEEQKTFDALMVRDEFRLEYQSWQQSILSPGEISVDKSGLYRTGETLSLSEATYEDHLIARAEGLLDEKQNRALETFARSKPNGSGDLRSADALRLSPPLGVFYPDKSKLYRKDRKPMVWWYRLSAVAAILILFWLSYPSADRDAPANRMPLTAMKSLPAKVDASLPGNALPNTLSVPAIGEAETVKSPKVIENSIAQTEGTKSSDHDPTDSDTADPEVLMPQRLEPIDAVAVLSLTNPGTPEILDLLEEAQPSEDSDLLASLSQPTVPVGSDGFLTIPEWALNKTLGNSSSESAESSLLALAEELKRKAGKALDAEVSRGTTQTAAGERQTFSFRVGGFSVERSSSK